MNKRKNNSYLGSCFKPIFICVFLVSLARWSFLGPLPTFDQLENPKNNLATEVISSDSVVIGKFFIDNRTTAKNEDIPQSFINALLATEDIRFREHSGIDIRALFRAIFGVVSGREQAGGASYNNTTISQNVIYKNTSFRC